MFLQTTESIWGYSLGFFLMTLLVSALLGIWAGKVGERNGRSFGLCFLAGFFLGLIGVLIVYLIGASPKATHYSHHPHRLPYPPERTSKVCHSCGMIIGSEANFCPYCGARV